MFSLSVVSVQARGTGEVRQVGEAVLTKFGVVVEFRS